MGVERFDKSILLKQSESANTTILKNGDTDENVFA